MSVILLIDDDLDLAGALTELLELKGHQVIAVHDGRQGLEYLRNEPRPSLILTDLIMPVMDGWEFLRLKNADPALADIPTVAMSWSVTESPPGAVEFLRKPFDIDRLLRLLP